MATNDYSAIFQEAGKTYNVDPQLLRAVVQVESGGKPNAVSEVGAQGLAQIMPTTAKALGVKNAFDPRENIFGAAKLLDENLTRYGNPNDAILAYHGGTDQKNWGPKTRAYLEKVTSAYQGRQGSKMASTVNTIGEMGANDDAFTAYFSGKSQPAAAPANDPFSAYFGNAPAAQPVKTVAPVQQAAPEPQRSAFDETARQVGLTGRAAITGLTALPTTIGDAANSLINLGIGGVNRLAGTNIPQLQMPSEVTQRAMNAIGVPQPQNATERVVQDVAGAMAGTGGQMRLGQALLNVPAAAATGRALTTAPVAQIAGAAGGAGAQGAARENDVGLAGQIGASLVGSMLPVLGASAATSTARAIGNRLAPPQSRPMPPEVTAPPTIGQQAPAPGPIPTANKPKYIPNGDGTFTLVEPGKPVTAPITQAAPEPFTVPTLPAPKSKLSLADQKANIDVMNEIGLTSQRPSAITGDKFTAGTEFQHSKLDSPVGEVVRNQLQTEQTALKDYGTKIIRNTGAAANAPEEVGQTVRAPLQGLSEHYDTQVRGLYAAADQQAGGMASVTPTSFGKLMGTNSVFAGKQENSALRRGINAYMREQGIVDSKGNIQPVTVQQAEGMRQYLNSQWSPQNSGLIGKIKESLDMDVAKAGGADLYKQARALHAERKNTLDNPKGIAALLNESGPDGINKLVPDEKMSAKILSMPTAQLEHVVNTLKNLPEHLQAQGQQALAEIRGVLAKRIYGAGDRGGTQNGPSMWNAANVTRELNTQNSKLNLVFSPDEMSQFQTLNRAGHILQTPSAYPGAAVQGHNLLQRGLILAPPAAGAVLGQAVGGLPGAAVGSALGSSLSGRVTSAVENANARRLAEQLMNPRPMK